MTTIISEYMSEVGRCKILCETGHDRYEARKTPDLSEYSTFQEQLLALYQRVVECRNKCPTRYDNDPSLKLTEDFLPSILNYLQFSEFQTGDVEGAARNAAFYLQLVPG